MQGVPFHQTCIRKEPRLPDSLLSCSHSLATQALQSTVCQPHLPVPVSVTGLCWFSTSSGLNKLGVSRTLSQPGEVKGLQQATLTPRAGNQPDGAMVTCPPQSMEGGQLVTPYLCVPIAAGVTSLPFQGPVLGGPHFLETFANRDAKWQQRAGQCIRGWFCPAKHLPCGADTVESQGLAQNLTCLELEQWKAQEHQSRGGNERES